MKKKRGVVVALIMLALAGGGVWFGLSQGQKTSSGVAVQTVSVEARSLDDIIEVSGHLKAKDEQEIRSPLAGMVTEVFVTVGQNVKKGDRLASLDTSEQQQALADIAFQIDQEKFAGNLRKVALLEGKAATLHRALEDQTMRAHLDGKVSRLDLKVGDIVKAGDTYGRIIDVASLTASVEVSETDIPRARVGQPVEFRFPALPGLVVQGRVASFPAEARINDRGLTVLDAQLVIDSPPPNLLPAFSFQAIVQVGPPRKVLVVDSRAVTYEAGKPRVERRKASGDWEVVPVETEGFGSSMVRLVSGCVEGDVVKLPVNPGAAP